MHQESFSVSVRDVARAAARLREFVDQTPMVSPSAVCDATGRTVILKCENLQRTGSFKVRGALHALLQMPPQGRARGVVTDSSGNFGLGLAWGARLLGVEVSIVMPEDAPAVKQERTASLGAKVHLSGATLADRARVADEVALATGAVYVSPHDDLDVIAGQGTAAMEIVEQVSPVESVVVPVGGGGLISGVAVVVKARWPKHG